MKNGLPELSHMQYAILASLGVYTRTGEDLRALFNHRTGLSFKAEPKFYILMKRLTASKMVRSRFRKQGKTRILVYKATSKGRKHAFESWNFYNK